METRTLRLLEGFALEPAEAALRLPVAIQRLLAFVALRGSCHRSVLAGTLWPDVPEMQALARLRTDVWRLNKLAPGLLRVEGASIALSECVAVDCRQQERFASALLRQGGGDVDWLRAGLRTLWAGTLLPGWYDDWVLRERERLAQLRLHALELMAQLLVDEDELEVALQLALEAVRTEPLRETANAVLMRVYLAEGNVSDAVRQYHLFRRHLNAELGLDPSPGLRELLPRPRRPLASR